MNHGSNGVRPPPARSPPTCAPLVTSRNHFGGRDSKQVEILQRAAAAAPKKAKGWGREFKRGSVFGPKLTHWPSTCHCGTSFCARAMSPSKNAAARGGGGHGGGKPTHFLAVRLSPASVHRPLESERGYRVLRRSPRWSEAGSLDYLRDVTYY